MPEGLDKLAAGVGKAIETVPELYEDALQPAAKESGKTLALPLQVVNAALSGVRIWVANREYKVAETEKLLAKKLENVNPEKVVPPEPYVAVPALQAISYSVDCEELRELYANLLAHSMYEDTKNSVHPAFVEIIKQLSPLDARVFKEIMNRPANPCVHLVYEDSNGIYTRIMQNVTDLSISTPELISVSIDNLHRLKLIYIPEDGFYTEDYLYDPIIKSSFYQTQKRLHPETSDGFKFSHQKKIIYTTPFGELFHQICILDPK